MSYVRDRRGLYGPIYIYIYIYIYSEAKKSFKCFFESINAYSDRPDHAVFGTVYFWKFRKLRKGPYKPLYVFRGVTGEYLGLRPDAAIYCLMGNGNGPSACSCSVQQWTRLAPLIIDLLHCIRRQETTSLFCDLDFHLLPWLLIIWRSCSLDLKTV